jgi:hypothetical protein
MYIKSIREQLKRAERQYPAVPNLAAAGASLLSFTTASAVVHAGWLLDDG